MLCIKQLISKQYKDAIDIKHNCIKNDYLKIVTSDIIKSLDTRKELSSLSQWMSNQGNDIRTMYGAFTNNKMVGFIGASLSEKADSDNGVEINYLFVDKNHRGKGMGIRLMHDCLSQYFKRSIKDVIIYNFRETASNDFYRSLNGVVIRSDIQNWCGSELFVDIFKWDMDTLLKTLKSKLKRS